MSLLQRGRETVTVYPSVTVTDSDGNKITRPGTAGFLARGSVQPISSTEDDGLPEVRYRLRLSNAMSGVLDARSSVDWNGDRYSILGPPQKHNGSSRSAHVTYVMVRR